MQRGARDHSPQARLSRLCFVPESAPYRSRPRIFFIISLAGAILAAAWIDPGGFGLRGAAATELTTDALQILAPQGEDVVEEIVHHCVADEEGRLSGAPVLMQVDRRPTPEALLARGAVNVVTLVNNGPSANRLDVVFVGDGYTAGQLGQYATHVQNMANGFFTVEPYITYANYYNLHRVDVISAESGVDHDPDYPIWRNTALDMGFWCSGQERLLCVNVGSAWAYALAAPDCQQIVAVANSTKYGGAGYLTSNVATTSGNNTWTLELMRHEMGHSYGKLADEYGGGCHYSGPEPTHENVSIFTAAQMESNGAKWANWLNYNAGAAYDGLISTYAGAHYCNTGIHRPTQNSKMRTLGRPFNLPSIEALIVKMYEIIDPIDDASPPGTYSGADMLTVTPMQPIGHALAIQWLLDGKPISGANSASLVPATLGLSPGIYDLSVSVRDETDFVRNESARDLYMTSIRTWQVVIVDDLPGDINGDGVVDETDLLLFVAVLLGANTDEDHIARSDLNDDGVADGLDISPFAFAILGL